MTTSGGRAVLGAGLLGGIATASGIALTATSGWLIVRASERPVILMLLTAIVAVRTFGMARPVFRYWERLRSHDVALADLADRRATAYARLIPLTPARLGRRGRADLLTGVVDDLSDVVDAQVRVTVPILSTIVASVLAVIVAALLSPRAGLVVAAMSTVTVAIFVLGWRLETRSQQTLLAARSEVARVTALVAGNASELQAIGAQGQAQSWLVTAHADLRRAAGRQSYGRAAAAGLLLLLTAAGTIAMTAAILPGVGAAISTPVAALLVLMPIALGDAFSTLPDAMRALARSQASAVRLHAMLDQQPAVRAAGVLSLDTQTDPQTDTPSGMPSRILVSDLTAAWAGTAPDVGPLDLEVQRGQHLAITGPNGCGKSTLLAVLARHLDPTGGDYRLGDDDALQLELGQARQVFAVLDDEPHLFASTLRANLQLARPGSADPDLVEAMTNAGLGQWFGDLALGLDTVIGSGGRGVSGGERARLGLARCLVSERPVLLLDEPVAHLDHTTAEAVLGDLTRSTTERSVIMVSHRPDGLAGFDRVIGLSRP
ncbi:MAG: thiol reductant ABC exporter subunit CydC [Phycicoccus sp.]|nr:thiol reductant ABC exporter subunit CydC [Phycicoccus sp.]NMM34271.1 thiol reductant ABC exporter subunit CydC [Phycicoccus sp.]